MLPARSNLLLQITWLNNPHGPSSTCEIAFIYFYFRNPSLQNSPPTILLVLLCWRIARFLTIQPLCNVWLNAPTAMLVKSPAKNTAIHWGGNATTYSSTQYLMTTAPNAAIAELTEPIPPPAAPCKNCHPTKQFSLCHSMCASSKIHDQKPRGLQILPPTPALQLPNSTSHNAAFISTIKKTGIRGNIDLSVA